MSKILIFFLKGDLGIVPRQTEQLNTKLEKNKFAAPQKELGNIKKLTLRSISTQTIDFTKVFNSKITT